MEAAEKVSLMPWTQFSNLVRSQREADNEEAARHLIRLRCAFDLESFARIFFPHYARLPFNTFHQDYFADVHFGERKVRRCRAAPRGYAKSTLAALIKPLHDVCYGLERFIVVISNTQPQANSKLKDIRAEVLINTRLSDIYGLQFPRRNPGETAYIIGAGDNQTMFQAVGAGAEIRGIRFGDARPSKIIVDDCEHSEEVLNEEIRRKYEEWYFDVVCKIGDENTNIEFIGTILHDESLLAKLLKNPGYEPRLYRAVMSWSDREDLWSRWRQIYTNLDDDKRRENAQKFYHDNEVDLLKGVKVLWPEKEPYLELMKELIEQGRRSFMKEKQNQPIGDDSKVFETLHWYHETPDGILIESSGAVIPYDQLQGTAYGVLDPASGKRRASSLGDFTCILTGYKDPRGRLLVHSDWTKREPPTKYIKQIFTLHREFDYVKFGVEENMYQELLIPNLKDEKGRQEKETGQLSHLSFYQIVQTKNKIERITAIEPKVTHGYVLFNRALSQEFIGQLLNFPGQHDDGPDALEMLWNITFNRYKSGPMSLPLMSGR